MVYFLQNSLHLYFATKLIDNAVIIKHEHLRKQESQENVM